MKKIEHALKELVRTVLSIAFMNSVIDSLVVFLIFLLIFNLTMIKWYYSFIPFFVYFIFNCYLTIRNARIKYIEKQLPFLKEQLITVNDYIKRDENEMISALNEEVLQKMREIKNSYFIKFGKITGRVLTMVVISFLIIFASAYNFHLFDFNKVVNDIKTGRFSGSYPVDMTDLTFQINESEDIYGNKSVIEQGYQDLKLQINPAESDIDINKVKPPEQKDFKSYAAKEIFATTDASYEENIPKNYHKIVKSYFTQISKEE